jgi:hypothetical protein
VSVSSTLVQATPYSALYTLTSPGGTASAPAVIDILSEYAALYGAGATATPLGLLLNNNGAPYASSGAALAAVFLNCDVVYTNAVVSAGYTGMSTSFQIVGAAVGNIRMVAQDVKDANVNGGTGYLRVSLRHSIVR